MTQLRSSIAGDHGRFCILLLLALFLSGGCQYWGTKSKRTTHIGALIPIAAPGVAPSRTAAAKTLSTPHDDVRMPDRGTLALDHARRLALAGNPDLHAAQARLEAAQARMADARARFLPSVSFQHKSTVTFLTPPSRPRLTSAIQSAQAIPTTGTDSLQSVSPLIRPFFEPLFGSSNFILRSNSNPFSDHSTGLTFTWTVFDGFIRDAQLLATKHLRGAADRTLADVKRLIVRAVDRAYFQVQLAGEQLRIARADEVFSREQLEETEKLRGAGRATQADVANFRVRMLAAQADVTAAVGLRDTGRVILAELMGRSDVLLPDDVDLAPLSEEVDSDLALASAEPWINHAAVHRPDLRRLSAVVDSEQQNVRAVKGLFSPRVGLSGSWGYDRTSNVRYSEDDQSSAGGIEVRWDLYAGGSRRARLRGSQAIYAEARAVLARLRLSVQAEVRQAVIDLTDAQEQIRLQRENLSTALENRRVVRAGYLAGKETLTRLNEAQRDYIEADAGLARSRIRLRLAWSDLHAAAAFDSEEKIEP